MAIKGEKVGRYITGCEVVIPESNIFISQPTVETVLRFGENSFFEVVNFLVQLKNLLSDMQSQYSEANFLSELSFFLAAYSEDPRLRKSVNEFFELVFPQYKVEITANSIDFKDLEKGTVRGRINPFNFDFLKDTIDELFLPNSIRDSEQNYNTVSAEANRIAEKLRSGRQKIAKQRNEDDTDNSMFGTYLSILSIGLGMDINILLKYTPFQLYDAFERYMAKETSDKHFKISTIPFADTSKLEEPEHWTRNLYK